MFHNNNKLVFHKLIEVIGGRFLDNTIDKYNGDFRSQHFDTKSHLYSLIYMNIRGCKSLRELKAETSSNKKLKRLINVPSVSQFSRKNSNRDYRIFEDIFYHLVNKAYRKHGVPKILKELPPLKIIDSTVILTTLKLAPYLKLDSERAGIKVSTLFNGQYPEKINIVKAAVNDRKCLDNMFEDKESIYVFDRGYYDYRWYDMLTQQGIKFVTRSIQDAIVMEERIIDTNTQDDIYDTEVIMGSTPGGNLTFNSYREITVFDDNGEEVVFMTNIFDLPTSTIIDIYKNRWEIEIFFKWIKQNLKIKKFIGYNENALKIQIFCALITYMLIYLSSQNNNVHHSMLLLTRVIRANLLEDYDEYVMEYFKTG
jgi:hypothetical protein